MAGSRLQLTGPTSPAGELLANAARFCSQTLTLSVAGHRESIKVIVGDDCPDPAVARLPSPTDEHGRGLRLIEALGLSWGQTPWDGHLKRVWLSAAVPPGGALGVGCRVP